mgnify:CR=1 FL=1
MDTEKNNKDVVFLFGAGISIPIGIPAMEGIYKAYMNKKYSGISDRNKKTCEFFTSKMKINPDLEEFLLAANNILEFKDSGLNHFVENNISKVKSSAKIRDYNKSLRSSLKDVEEVRSGILDFLSRICFQFDRDEAEKINTGFVKTLANMGYPVYSTNYDYAFEHVALENDIQVLDNFVKKGQRILWNEDIDFEGDNGFKLIKLHGSVTWYEDAEGVVEKIYSSTDINPVGKEVGKIVIVPTRFKDIYSQNFFALYSHFLGSLARSKVIIIAGHSLRDDYLRAAIVERKRQGNFQVIVIDPSYPSEIKEELPPSRLGTNGDVIHLPYKWEEMADEISSILLNSEANQIGSNCTDVLKKHKYVKNKLKIKGNLGVLRIGETKKFIVDIQAYLNSHEKPSIIRVWLKATYRDDKGQQVERFYTNFAELCDIQFGNDLTGVVSATKEVSIKVPNIKKWLDAGCKVSLCVGLIKKQVKAPANVNSRNVIAEDSKLLNYQE